MSTTKKHHYRNVYKSDHLGVADLEEYLEQNPGKPLHFTIKEVKQEFGKSVAGKKGDFNIAYFYENIKPWVLNAGNAKIICQFANIGKPQEQWSKMVEDWKDIHVELYIDADVKMKGETVGGVRVRPAQPRPANQTKPVFTEANFEKAKAANALVETIKERYTLTPDVEKKYLDYVRTENAGVV